MSMLVCNICNKTFLCQNGLFSHLEKAHIENAQRHYKDTGATTVFVVEVEVLEIFMFDVGEPEEVKTEFVEIEVTATKITEKSASGKTVHKSVRGLNSLIHTIVSEKEFFDVASTSSESESADGTLSPDMDTHENTSNLDAPPNLVAESESKNADVTSSPDMGAHESNLGARPNLVGGATDESLESGSVHCASLPELENPTMVTSEVIVRTETVITQTTYETSKEVSADKIAEITSSSDEAMEDSSESLDKYFCHLCNRRFRSPANLHDHNMQHHAEVIVRTETVVTKTTYESSRTLVSGTTDESSESGSVDGTSAPEIKALETTSKGVSADKIAEITSGSDEAMEDSSESLDKYLCHLCNRRFRSPANLHDHNMQHHARK